ncbi:MAG: hypothetical protein HKN08_04750 [Gammaproteobacteria bacterium]|nr:hypothetical protein [Gammaproteobacteria bacterium]
MKLTVKLHGELAEYFPETDEEKNVSISVTKEDSILSVIHTLKIPAEKINLILVNGVKVDEADIAGHKFTDGDTLAVWPTNPKE